MQNSPVFAPLRSAEAKGRTQFTFGLNSLFSSVEAYTALIIRLEHLPRVALSNRAVTWLCSLWPVPRGRACALECLVLVGFWWWFVVGFGGVGFFFFSLKGQPFLETFPRRNVHFPMSRYASLSALLLGLCFNEVSRDEGNGVVVLQNTQRRGSSPVAENLPAPPSAARKAGTGCGL